MKLRITLSAILVLALGLPVIATATRYPDVPSDHQYAEAIEWASSPENFNGSPLFRGFPDGNFGPDQELTESQFSKVIERLFDTADRWTRAETAQLLYKGFPSLKPTTTTTTTTSTTTTRPVVIEQTTTTTIPTRYHDSQLRVAIHHDSDSNFIIRWLRPGWEDQTWKWRLYSGDSNCGFTNGVSNWQTSGRTFSNSWYDDGGLCIQTGSSPWQIEILWANGERYVSEACRSVGKEGDTRLTVWNCSTPSDYLDWPYYSDIPPVVSIDKVSPYYFTRGVSNFYITVNPTRRGYFWTEFCGLKQSIGWIEAGPNEVRLMCDITYPSRRLVVRHGDFSTGAVVVNQFITIPTGSRSGLTPQQLSPELSVSYTIDDYPTIHIDLDITVGTSTLAENAIITWYTNTGGWGHDIDGNTLTPWLDVRIFEDGIYKQDISTSRIYAGTIYYIQVHEPGAPTHHLTYTFNEEVTV